ncbi:hypothetical protein RHSIM_Rhsim02G0044600 [Rhododendron simsii]|uniref:EF-hand domain-containing protein n=1 Tax=Rhododendron simsii TaxID=118357 RepID=A0A834LX85_RHOSS|nr:hypothetical protein RHSIM_Rhsim02G0044600 [Rhododendron simsii]
MLSLRIRATKRQADPLGALPSQGPFTLRFLLLYKYKDMSSTNHQKKERICPVLSLNKKTKTCREREREMDYKNIREAALAYYANLSKEEQLKAWEFFKSIDTDGNGTISCSEYHSSLAKMGYTNTQNEFKMMDKDGDGVLDFEECITLFYKKTVHQGVSCNGCGINLWDIYFVCVGCYEAGGNTYDLCCDCYRKKNFEHQNAVFCDNITLLKRMQPAATSASQVRSFPSFFLFYWPKKIRIVTVSTK